MDRPPGTDIASCSGDTTGDAKVDQLLKDVLQKIYGPYAGSAGRHAATNKNTGDLARLMAGESKK